MKMNEKGFTLPELLIGMAITLVVTAAGYTFFNNTFNFSMLHSRTAEMQRESRVALDIMSREIRNAGFGIVEPLTGVIQGNPVVTASPVQAFNNVDPDPSGVANKLDRITVIEGLEIIGSLGAAALQGAATFTLTASPGVSLGPSLAGNTITIEGFYTGTVQSVAGTGPYTITVTPALNRNYTMLNAVLLVRTITYRVAVPTPGAEPVLYRNAGDGNGDQVIASGIEDLQFAYLLNDGTETNAPAAVAPPTVPAIRAVRISLLARSRDPNASSARISTRPALEDHEAGASADGYHRRLFTKVVEVRNLGL